MPDSLFVSSGRFLIFCGEVLTGSGDEGSFPPDQSGPLDDWNVDQFIGKVLANRYKVERRIAEAAGRDVKDAIITCAFLGMALEDGAYDAVATPKCNSELAFEWRVRAGSFDEVQV